MVEFENGVSKDIFPIKIYEAEYPNFENIKQQLIDNLKPHFNTLAPGNE